MKKITLLLCYISIAATSFAQIKTNRQIMKATEIYKPNTAAVMLVANTDSLELKQLFDNYKEADAVANIALDKLMAKIKSMNAAKPNATGTEMGMAQLQSLLLERARLLQMTTNLMNALNEGQKKILENIGR